MKHPSYVAGCRVCAINAGEQPSPGGIIFENGLWLIRHAPPPYSVPGWMMIHAQRHVSGPAYFDDAEAADFGFALRHFERVLEQVTGALRIYTAALGESFPHFHGHMIPKYAQMPFDATAMAVFDLQRRAAAGEIQVDDREIARITAAYARALRESPPPATVALEDATARA
jgi:diadenosine tetraphosphate (Ap4A) HIT family hydrolase